MKINLSNWLAAVLLAATTSTFAQSLDLEAVTGCLVSDATGKVTYTEKGSTMAKPVTAGTVIPDDATVTVGKKSSLTLVSGDRSLAFAQKGAHSMAVLAKEVAAKGERSRFAQMAFVAKGYGELPKDSSTRRKGWGGKDSIVFQPPIGGKLALQTATIRWYALKGGSVYKLTVYQTAKEMPVLEALTSAAEFTFDPAQLAVKTGQPCFVQVALASDGKVKSKQAKLIFAPLEQVENALAGLKKDKEYLKGSAQQKSLMEAAELENLEFWASANERYQAAIRLNGSNSLAKRMYTAFLDKVSR